MIRNAITLIAALAIASTPALANDQSFDSWLGDLRSEALQRGFSTSLVNETLSNIEPDDGIIELDRKQPESTMTLHQYLKRVVPEQRIRKARGLYEKHHALLKEVGERYGVQPRYIVALWGIESNFGERMGDYSIVEALATLAYDGRRSAYFRNELFNSLTILQEGHISPGDMKGSWAGAMGQCQFMPTSFLRYAVDQDGDGHKDIWNNEADVFASIANYLSSEGWNDKHGLGSPKDKKSNFNVLLKWNRSSYFATAVGKLADGIGKGV